MSCVRYKRTISMYSVLHVKTSVTRESVLKIFDGDKTFSPLASDAVLHVERLGNSPVYDMICQGCVICLEETSGSSNGCPTYVLTFCFVLLDNTMSDDFRRRLGHFESAKFITIDVKKVFTGCEDKRMVQFDIRYPAHQSDREGLSDERYISTKIRIIRASKENPFLKKIYDDVADPVDLFVNLKAQNNVDLGLPLTYDCSILSRSQRLQIGSSGYGAYISKIDCALSSAIVCGYRTLRKDIWQRLTEFSSTPDPNPENLWK